MTRPVNIRDKINTLGDQLLDEATKKQKQGVEGMAVKERVEIFKAASAWHLGIAKLEKNQDPDDTGAESFSAIRDRVNGT